MATRGDQDGEGTDPLAVVIGGRIAQAMEAARIDSAAELNRRTGIHERSVRRYLKGRIVPQVEALMAISAACHVSVDWLLFGERSEPNAAYLEWLASPSGQAASDAARTFLLRIPLFGYQPTPKFYEFAHIAWRDGLAPEHVAQVAHDTDRDTRR